MKKKKISSYHVRTHALSLTAVTRLSACTPPLKTPSVEIPDINFQPDDALKKQLAMLQKID